MEYYRDFREYLSWFDEAGLLVKIDRQVNKDTELHPLVRWQFRAGIEEPKRKAFLFNRVTASTGTDFEIPVVVGALGASRTIYALGMMCSDEEIVEKWEEALL